MLDKLKGKKTYLTALGTILATVGAWLTGDVALADGAQIIITAILAVFIRDGINTETEKLKK